jgi:hypothetical protein
MERKIMEPSFLYIAMNRKVMANNPRETDNILIQCTFDEIDSDPTVNNRSVLRDLIDDEYLSMGSDNDNSIPNPVQMIWHRIHLDWVNIIERMIFVEQNIGTFNAEYSDIIQKIINTTDRVSIDYPVYRYYSDGSTMFHLAARMYLLHEYAKIIGPAKILVSSIITGKVRHILSCYSDLGRFVNGNSTSITHLSDNSGKRLEDFITSYGEELVRRLHVGN